jgi:WD40 repeat protein
MKTTILMITALILSLALFTPAQSPVNATKFPEPDFVLHDTKRKTEKPRVVLGPMHTDANGKAAGSFAVYGGSSLIQVSSLSFSRDGKLLAVGSTPSIVDVWDMDSRAKIRSFTAGTTVALSPDGKWLATDGKKIEIWDVSRGKVHKSIEWGGDAMIQRMTFDSTGSLLLVTANGIEDMVFDVASGRKLVTLQYTREAQFSGDGSLVIGGNGKHLIAWSTKDWSKVYDLPNGPDYVTRFAVHPNNDLVVVGGPNSARLIRLSSGQEVAKVGVGYTLFAGFNRDGSLIFTYASRGFAVWSSAGTQVWGTPSLANARNATISPDDRWLVAGPPDRGTDIMVWNLPSILAGRGLPDKDSK